jgi:hypothetical protein
MLGWIVLGTVACCATCLIAGLTALRVLKIDLDRLEAICLGFALGSAIVSTLTLGIAFLFLARKGVFLGLAVAALLLGGRMWPWFRSLKPTSWKSVPASFRALFWVAWPVYGGLYLLHALEPAMPPDKYHLGFVNLWNHAHGMTRVVDCYAALPQGIEMLFLFAFSIGRHSTAAMVHLWFLMLLPVMMALYGARFGVNRGAAVFGAIVVFATPCVGWDGSLAYNDVALAMVVFATLYLLQIWRRSKNAGTLLATGLLAGFCVAIKYTGWFVLLPVAAVVLWELRRNPRVAAKALAVVALAAVLAPAPYLVRNWIWYRNPVAFFGNSVFPNPYFSVAFERSYVQGLAHANGITWAEVPMGLVFGGPKAPNSLGPIYALAPIALAALFWAEGRFLVLCALAASATFIWNKDPRFLLPALPLVMMAAGFVLSRIPRAIWALWLLAVVQVAASWPTVSTHLAWFRKAAPNLTDTDWRAALRLYPEQQYLARFSDYQIAREIESQVPPNQHVLSLGADIATPYTTRLIVDSYHSMAAQAATKLFFANEDSPRDNRWRWAATWAPTRVSEVRIREVRFLKGGLPVGPSPDWHWETSQTALDLGPLFDGAEVTSWYSGDNLHPGMYVGVRFAPAQIIDGVEVLSENPPWESPTEAQVFDAAGRALPASSGAWHSDPPVDLRKAATQALKREDIGYVVIDKGSWHGEAFRENPGAWGMHEIARSPNVSLYEID